MGFDKREELTYDIARFSILSRTSRPTRIIPIELGSGRLKNIYERPHEWKRNANGVMQLWCPISEAPMSTEFAISRFAVPFLQDSGWSLFIDCDMVCLDDISKLFDLADNQYAVMCVKHKHEPTEEYHDAGQLQTFYRRKNWSSVVLWNHSHPANKRLKLEHLNTWPGRDLHAFKWLDNEEIGSLPQEWNFLVGVNEGDLKAQKMLHYTNGQPGWDSWEPQDTDCVFNEEHARFRKERYEYYGKYMQRVGVYKYAY